MHNSSVQSAASQGGGVECGIIGVVVCRLVVLFVLFACVAKSARDGEKSS